MVITCLKILVLQMEEGNMIQFHIYKTHIEIVISLLMHQVLRTKYQTQLDSFQILKNPIQQLELKELVSMR